MLEKGPVVGAMREVTFVLPPEFEGDSVHLCGDFNDWSQTSLPMERSADGAMRVSVSLPCGRRYRYRYLVEGSRWENDWMADDYVPNEFGGEDSAVDA